jgi:hypothetical protein
MAADLPQDLRRQVPAGLPVLGFVRHVITVQSELIAEPRGRAAGPGRAQLPRRGQQLADLAAAQHPGQLADLAAGIQVAEAIEEQLDVGAAQRCRVLAAVGALPQAGRQQGQARQVVAGLVSAAAPAAAGQVGERPDLGGLPQPRLGDRGERQVAAVPEQRHIPDVPGDLGARIGNAAAGVRDQRVHDAGIALAAAGQDVKLRQG